MGSTPTNNIPVVSNFNIKNTANQAVSQAVIGESLFFSVTASDPDSGDSVSKVIFYEVIDGNATQIGMDDDSSNGWSWTWRVPADHSLGNIKLRAVAMDTFQEISNPADTSFTFIAPDNPPVITKLSVDNLTPRIGQHINISGTVVDMDGDLLGSVRLFIDLNKDGLGQFPEELIGTANIDASGSWSYSWDTANFSGNKEYDIVAEAWDVNLVKSELAKQNVTFTNRSPCDFDGNGKSDILLQHSSTSLLGIWSDANTAEWNTFGNIPNGWDIAGIGDMNNNGISDVILQSSHGDVGMWAGGLSSNWTGFGNIGTGWTISAVGDFNGNGKDDLLLRYTTGYLGMWESGTSWTGLADLSNDWKIVGVGDFDRTGTDDIVLQYTNGTIGTWMNGNPANWNNVGAISSIWEIAGVGDFSNDGKDDFLLHDTVGGTLGLWKDGNSANWQNAGVLPDGWKVSGIGDFNADGNDDILLGSNQGHVGMWASGSSENWLEFGKFDSANWSICNSIQ